MGAEFRVDVPDLGPEAEGGRENDCGQKDEAFHDVLSFRCLSLHSTGVQP